MYMWDMIDNYYSSIVQSYAMVLARLFDLLVLTHSPATALLRSTSAKITIVNQTNAVLSWSLSGSISNIYQADIQKLTSTPGTSPSVLSAFHSEPFSLKGKLTSSEVFFNPSKENISSLLAAKKLTFDVLTSTVCQSLCVWKLIMHLWSSYT